MAVTAAPNGDLGESSGPKTEPQDFKVEVAYKQFCLRSQALEQKAKAKLQSELLEACFEQDLAPLYQQLCAEFGWSEDAERLQAMQSKNEAQLKELEDKITDADENLGDVEVRDAFLARADHLCRLGDREKALTAYEATLQKTAGVGLKLDILFSMLRLDIAAGEWTIFKDRLKQAKELCGKGGDWERKNRLKVYEALFLLATRDFKHAASLFLDSIATFTATELFPYETCIFYTVVTTLITLERPELKAKVIDAPEILTVIDSIPNLTPFLNCFYTCHYKGFFQAFAAVTDQIRGDMYLQPHLRYYIREVRNVAYAQFLESYKSVTIDSMAQAFGVTPDFIDRELVDFIVAGRLPAKIDKVSGVIETNRPDAKNAYYQQTIKQGDLLLNRLQKLAKIIDVE